MNSTITDHKVRHKDEMIKITTTTPTVILSYEWDEVCDVIPQ